MKKFFSLLTAALFAGSMFAAEITVSKSVSDLFGGVADQTQKLELYSDGVLTISVSEGDNNGKLYGNGAEWRVYQSGNAVVTVAVKTGTIKTVSFTYDVKNTGTLLFGGNSLASDANATVNAASAQFVVGNTGSATNGLVKIKSFTVVYDGEAGTESDSVDDGGQGGDQGGDQGGNAQNFTFNTIETYNYYDYMSEDGEDITIYMYNKANPGVYAQLDIIVPNGTGLGELPVGTYNITDTYAVNTAVVGGVDESYYPIGCWVFGEGEEDYWDLVSGTVVVAKSGDNYTITVKAEDSEGNSYVITYTGAVNIEEGEFAEEEGIENITLTEKAQKVVVDGVVYIIRDNKLYNLQGTQVR